MFHGLTGQLQAVHTAPNVQRFFCQQFYIPEDAMWEYYLPGKTKLWI